MSLQKRVSLTGIEKTAILMNVLGKEKAFEFLRELSDTDVKKLLKVVGSMKKAPIGLVVAVLKEFLTKISEQEELIFDENEIRPEVISEILGEERAKAIFGSLSSSTIVDEKVLGILDTIEPKLLARYLADEHPQTTALVLAHMEPEKQLQTIKLFPEQLRAEIVLRLANLDYVAPEKVSEIDEVLKNELGLIGKEKKERLGGVPKVAELINNLDQKSMNALIARLEDKDPILAEEIRQHMFTFTDLVRIDERFMQLILREISGPRLLLALKGAPEELREKIYRSMSSRAAEMLRDDLQALGPQKISDVEGAQREIVKVVKKLEQEGKIVIGVGEGEEIVA